MGFNTVAFMLNDHCHDIEADPRLSQVIHRAMASGMGSEHEVPGLTILPSHHADYNHLVLAGGNRIEQIASFGRGVEYTKEGVMRALAKELGFSVSRDSGSRAEH